MRDISKYIGLFIMMSVVTSDAISAQARWVAIDTNQPEAMVYADSTWLGTAMQHVLSVPENTRQITVVPPTVDTWSIRSIAYRLTESDADTVTVTAHFPFYYRIESVPSGATVFLEDGGQRNRLGVTPMDYVADRPLVGELSFDLDGYLIRRATPGQDLWNRHLVLLEGMSRSGARPSDLAVSGKSNHRWIDIAAIGLAVGGGLLAVHYKTKADNRYDRYNETRNPSLKSEIRRLDVYSGVALGAMQVGVGVLAFRLVF